MSAAGNYRHAFHAGNFADVVKHASLLALLRAMTTKPAPLCHFETHAGRGLYDLGGEAATRTGEAASGIARVLAASALPPALQDYATLVRGLPGNAPAAALRHYPGSPLLAALALRPQDRLVLCELQAEEARALRGAFRDDPRVHVHQRDGYAALQALLPPAEKRGIIFVDPPFEGQEHEFDRISQALAGSTARWPGARIAVWYPIKLGRQVRPFHRWLAAEWPGRVLVGELLLHPDNTELRLNGCGMAFVNPPWHFEGTLGAILDALAPLLADADVGPAQTRVFAPG